MKPSVGTSVFLSFVCVTTLFLSSFYLLFKEWQINHNFIQTDCRILDEHLNHSVKINNGSTQLLYSPTFFISYEVGNKLIRQWSGLSPIRLSTPYLIDNRNGFIKGESYPCWYNPDNPRIVVLERGYSLFSLAFLLLSLYLFVTIFYLMIKNLRVQQHDS